MTSGLAAIRELELSSSEEAMLAVVEAAREPSFGSAEVYSLARILAESGTSLNLDDRPIADIASTGGPSSLSTLIGPTCLAASGLGVAALGVPGRPAGGVDVLAQIPGYRVQLERGAAEEIYNRCGYVHFLANDDFAPLDSKMFRFRQRIGAQNIPALAAASLLSKKIVCGVNYVGLDIRVAPHGNFGATLEEARRHAALFRDAAGLANIQSICFLTDARFPYQPFIGRGETLLALSQIFDGTANEVLRQHFHRCGLMAQHVAAMNGNCFSLEVDRIREAFHRNVDAQGGSWTGFKDKAARVRDAHRYELEAEHSGFVHVDLRLLRDLVVLQNDGGRADEVFSDVFGVILRSKAGDFVEKGAILATARMNDSAWPTVYPALCAAVSVKPLPISVPGLECETGD